MLTENQSSRARGAPYKIAAGTQLWQAYTELYKRYGVTIPGGDVRLGGCRRPYYWWWLRHVVATPWVDGGLALCSRDFEPSTAKGKAVPRRVDRTHDPDLFRACRRRRVEATSASSQLTSSISCRSLHRRYAGTHILDLGRYDAGTLYEDIDRRSVIIGRDARQGSGYWGMICCSCRLAPGGRAIRHVGAVLQS